MSLCGYRWDWCRCECLQETDIWVSSSIFSIFYNILYYVILSSLPLEPRAIDSASVSPQIPLWIPCLHLLARGNMSELPCPPGTYLGAEDLNSGPHTCGANTVLTESSRHICKQTRLACSNILFINVISEQILQNPFLFLGTLRDTEVHMLQDNRIYWTQTMVIR